MRQSKPILLVFILTIFLCGACRKGGDVIHMSLDTVDTQDQRTIGDAMYNRILTDKKASLLSETDYYNAHNYLNALLRTVLNTSVIIHREDFNWTINIFNNDEEQMIYSTPGGHVFVSTGLLRFIKSENELLSIIAHEIYYVDTDLNINRLLKTYDNANLIFGDIVLGNEVKELSDISKSVAHLTYSDDEVTSADKFSVSLLCPFQYEAKGLLTVIERMMSASIHIEWFDFRKANNNLRIDEIRKLASICGAQEPTFEERYQDFVRKHLP